MRLFTILVLVALTSPMALADGGPPLVELGVGTNLTKFSYKELCTPNDTENASFASMVGDLKIHPGDNWSFVEARYESAKTSSNYSGASLQTNQSMFATDTLQFTDYSLTLNFALGDATYVYLGYGHHVWNRFISGGNGYREIYSWDYTPVGMQNWYFRSDWLDAGIDVSLKPMANGKIQIITSETIAGGQDSSAALGNKMGFKISLPMTFKSGNFFFRTTPWFEHGEIGQSDVVTNTTLFSTSPYQGDEPNSESYFWGLEVLTGFSF